MREPRLYTEQPLAPGAEVVLEARPARHAAQVLRLTAGAPVILFNGDGIDYAGCILAGPRDAIRVRIDQAGAPEPATPLSVTLAIGIAKGERMDFALQKAVELGVAAIQPLFTRRSVVRLDAARLIKRQQHWQGVIIGACEQSGRRRLPALGTARGLMDWLQAAPPDGPTAGTRVRLDHRAEHPLTALPAPADGLVLLIGPEGGLAPEEREAADAHGFSGVRLGPRVMRTETAPLAALAVIQALWGDFRR